MIQFELLSDNAQGILGEKANTMNGEKIY